MVGGLDKISKTTIYGNCYGLYVTSIGTCGKPQGLGNVDLMLMGRVDPTAGQSYLTQ